MPENVIEMLKNDHDKVRSLLSQLTSSSEDSKNKRQELLDKIEEELRIHTLLEEEIFYPAFKESDGREYDKMYFEAREEHRAVEELVLPDLKNTSPTSTAFSGRAKVLKELVEHHAREEEEEMFVKARQSMSADRLQVLGSQMEKRKRELKEPA